MNYLIGNSTNMEKHEDINACYSNDLKANDNVKLMEICQHILIRFVLFKSIKNLTSQFTNMIKT